MDYSPTVSSVHGILQARILERVAIPFSRGSSQPRDRNLVSSLQTDSLLSELQGSPHRGPVILGNWDEQAQGRSDCFLEKGNMNSEVLVGLLSTR